MWIAAAVVVGLASGPTLRAAIFAHSVPPGEPWRTACPTCDTPLVRPGWRLVTGALRPSGRCPHCRTRIGPPAWLVEIVAGVTLGVLAWRAGPGVATIGLLWAALVSVVLAAVDIAVHRLPDRLILTALAGAVVFFAAAGDFRRLGVAVLCGLGGGIVYFVMVFISPRGMGLGDAKLAVLVGLTAGWYGIAAAFAGIFAGLLFAGLTAIVLLALRRVKRTDRLAHGPFMLLGALAAIILATI